MAQGDVIVTVIGNITQDPELRFTQSGVAVANFTIVTNPRKFNKNSNQWEDGEPTFYRVNVWRQHAENVSESLRKGDRAVVVGALQNRKYETDNGTRYSLEITADAVALDTRWAIVQARKAERQQGGQQGYQQQPQQGYGSNAPADPWTSPPPQQGQQQRPNQAPPQSDPWGSAAPAPAGGGGQAGMFPDEPPFAVDPRAFEFIA